MNRKSNRHSLVPLLILVLAISVLAGCKGQNQPVETPTPEVTAVPATATPVPDEIVFVDAQGNAAEDLVSVITTFASENSFQYRSLTGITSTDITSGMKIVVFNSDPGNLAELSGAAPATQFLVLGSGSVSAGGNISTIQSDPADTAFMAGYITMLVAEDWHAAGLVTSDGPLGNAYADTFTNGARYVCGRCSPYYGTVSFPQVGYEPSASDDATWLIDATDLGLDYLSAVFIDPAAASLAVGNALAARPMNYESVIFISTADVSPDTGLVWDALLSADYVTPVKTMLPLLLSGQGGNQASATVTLTSVNEETISPARQDRFAQTAQALADGEIEPRSVE